MEFEIKELAKEVNGKIKGKENALVKEITIPEENTYSSLSFILDEKTREKNKEKKFYCVVTKEELLEGLIYESAIVVNDVKRAMVKILSMFVEKRKEKGISPFSHISPKANIGEGVTVSPFCVIEEHAEIGKGSFLYPFVYIGKRVRIGEGCVIHPFVSIGEKCEIGNSVILFSGVTIGADGFGYIEEKEGLVKIPQIGNVIIEDNCEIGANTTIDRATIGATRIKRGTKIDNLVQIAHNCEIGEDVVIAAQTGLAGSVKVGKRVKMGGQVGVADHLEIGDYSILTAKAGVGKNVPSKKIYSGYFAREHTEVLRAFTLLYSLPKHWNKIKKLLY